MQGFRITLGLSLEHHRQHERKLPMPLLDNMPSYFFLLIKCVISNTIQPVSLFPHENNGLRSSFFSSESNSSNCQYIERDQSLQMPEAKNKSNLAVYFILIFKNKDCRLQQSVRVQSQNEEELQSQASNQYSKQHVCQF